MIFATPGDYDVGEKPEPKLLSQFSKNFPSPPCGQVRSVVFVEINQLSEPKCNENYAHAISTIAFSHLSVLRSPGNDSPYVSKMLSNWKPEVIFTGNVGHRATMVAEDVRLMLKPPEKEEYWRLTALSGDPVEIQVPTCSYRMGRVSAGFGLALIGEARNSILETGLI